MTVMTKQIIKLNGRRGEEGHIILWSTKSTKRSLTPNSVPKRYQRNSGQVRPALSWKQGISDGADSKITTLCIWLCLPTPNAIQNDRRSPSLPPFSVFKPPPSSLLKDSKALPQSRNPLINRARRHSRLRAKEPRKMCPQTLKRPLLEPKTLMLHSKRHSNRTFPSTLYTVGRCLARWDTRWGRG